jgi:light-regulated signal transduction histidine kinase (bacteriophytochrome)
VSIIYPKFGTADLTNCEREQIHLAGSIQPHGALLVVSDSDLTILQASANAREFFGLDRDPQGLPLEALGGDLWRGVKQTPRVRSPIPYVTPCTGGADLKPLNALLHRAGPGEIVVELERAGGGHDFSADIERALATMLGANSLQSLCDECARVFKEIAGYDRVMIYRFDDEGHGEVYAETRRPELEPFLGNRYPASDIPQIARRLYMTNRVRMLADVDYQPAPLVPRLSPVSGAELDMSMCFLRSVSPIHIQYLKNMGVAATLVVSLMVGDKLWGLVSCHHYSPRRLHFELRSVCELLGEALGTRIAALESFWQSQGEMSVRRLEARMVETISRDGDWRGALFDTSRSLLLPLSAEGAALLFENEIRAIGETPSTEDIRALGRWIGPQLRDGLFATSALPAVAPNFAHLTGPASGVVATPVSADASEMLLWFRPERVRTVTWGGNPYKAPSSGDDPLELSPRRSFAQWHQVVEGTSDPWTAADLNAARLIGASVSDVILQFRAASLVIARDQLEQVRARVHASEQQTLVADPAGAVLEINAAFEALVGAAPGEIRRLDDLPPRFRDPAAFAARLQALTQTRRSWRGEATLETGAELHLRADAVIGADDRLLGFVLLATDLSNRRGAETALARFQAEMLASQRRLAGRLEATPDPKARKLLAGLIENAQLAALEISESEGAQAVPARLKSLGDSVARSAEVLERLAFEERVRREGG